jgi:hypothetical protein
LQFDEVLFGPFDFQPNKGEPFVGIHNLRSALDHITRQLVLVALGVTDTKCEPHFANWDKSSRYETGLKKNETEELAPR